jgi:hypothetical protein
MGFFSKIFKGIKKVVKGIGKVIKKVVKSKAFKVVAAVALAVVAPQMIPTIMKGISTAGAWAANTIATGASAVWTGVKAAGSALMSGAKAVGTGIKSFGSKVFQSVTETITKGVDFLKVKTGFGTPSTLTGSSPLATEQAVSNFFGREAVGSNVAKKTLGEKLIGIGGSFGQNIVEDIKGSAKDKAKETILDKIAGERKEESLLGQKTYVKSIGGYSSTEGYAPLMNLAANIQSPYISYNQGQQLFGMPEPTAG